MRKMLLLMLGLASSAAHAKPLDFTQDFHRHPGAG